MILPCLFLVLTSTALSDALTAKNPDIIQPSPSPYGSQWFHSWYQIMEQILPKGRLPPLKVVHQDTEHQILESQNTSQEQADPFEVNSILLENTPSEAFESYLGTQDRPTTQGTIEQVIEKRMLEFLKRDAPKLLEKFPVDLPFLQASNLERVPNVTSLSSNGTSNSSDHQPLEGGLDWISSGPRLQDYRLMADLTMYLCPSPNAEIPSMEVQTTAWKLEPSEARKTFLEFLADPKHLVELYVCNIHGKPMSLSHIKNAIFASSRIIELVN